MSDDFNIPRFVRFMNDLEQDNIPSYTSNNVVQENVSNFVDMLNNQDIMNEQGASQAMANLLKGTVSGLGKTLKSVGFGIGSLTKKALGDMDIPILTNRSEKKKFARATDELYKSYREDLHGVIDTYAKEFQVFGKDFMKDVMGVMSANKRQEKNFLTANERTFIKLRKGLMEFRRDIKAIIPAEHKNNSIKGYMLAVNKNKRSKEFNTLVSNYTKWVEKATKEMFFPLIKDFSAFIMIEYVKFKSKKKPTVTEDFNKVDTIYKLFETLDTGE